MLIKLLALRISFFNTMDNSSGTVKAGRVWAFQYVTQFQSWLKASVLRCSCCKIHKQRGLWKGRGLLTSAFFKNDNAYVKKRYGN